MADNTYPKKPQRALVRRTESRALARPSLVSIQLARLSEGGKAIANAIPEPVKAVSRHSAHFCARTLGVVALVVFALAAGAYARLLSGPISFEFLVPKIQDQLNSQLQGYRFHVGNAILRLSDSWGLEFRLADVSLLDRDGQELAKAPFAAVDVSEPSLLRLSLVPAAINLLGPKVLIFNVPGRGFTLTSSPDRNGLAALPNRSQSGKTEHGESPDRGAAMAAESPEVAGVRKLARQAAQTPPAGQRFNPAAFLTSLFAALDRRGGASTALQRIGMQNATIYFANDDTVSTWHVADFHIDLEERSALSSLHGELTLEQDAAPWRISFRAVNRPHQKRYSLTAALQDVVPRTIWKSFPSIEALKLVDLPITGTARFELSHDGSFLGGETEIELRGGKFFAPWDDKHPAVIDGGVIRLSYDKGRDEISIKPFELRWEESLLSLSGSIFRRANPRNETEWVMDLDGGNTKLGAPQFGVPVLGLDAFRLTGVYKTATDTVILNELRIKAAEAQIAASGEASNVTSGGGAVAVKGSISPMPLAFFKVIWPAFVANGARDWIGTNIPAGRIAGGSFAVNLSQETLAALNNGGDVPDAAVSLRLALSGLQIYHIKGLPPILTKETSARVVGRHFIFDIPADARIEVPSGRTISFSDGQFIVDDLRPRFPSGEIHFKCTADVAGGLELLDQPPLGYVKAVGFKTDLLNGQVATAFKITLPLLKDVKFKQMSLSGKARVSDLKSDNLPGGLTVNGGAVNFDVSETAISANGDVKLNGVPVSLAWQRIFDAPPEKQPTLRVAGILNEKARDELGLNVNHIVKGDLPIALAVAMQRDGPPKLFMEANLTNTDIYLTAIGWRKPPGQKATLTFDLNQGEDNSILLDNFVLAGDGLNISGHLVLNDKRRIAGFEFPEFSTNALTQLQISGELTPHNVLKVQAKGPSYDGRQFFRSLFSAGKLAENQPAPLKDEPGLDLNVEIDTVFGFYDSTVKSVVVNAKRRNGKLTFLDVAGRLNGEAPIAVRVEQKPGEPRTLVSEATDAGSALRMVGFYPAVRGGQMTLRVNLDGSGHAEKTGTLYVQKFLVVGDQVVGKVVSQAEQEGARRRPNGRSAAPSSGAPMQFDRMWVPFSVGSNQFILHDSAINGPLVGATLRGRIDYAHETLSLSGTYVPLYGLNAVLGGVPLLGDLLTGREGEGVFGVTFGVQGRTSNPEVVVNPMSIVAPGFLRQIFEFDSSTGQAVQQQRQAPDLRGQVQR